MIFQTSTPKKRTLTPLPRSSTPNQYSQKKINYQIPMIKLDLLLYRPKTECYYRQDNLKQIWDI
jgi:hypothetical protein